MEVRPATEGDWDGITAVAELVGQGGEGGGGDRRYLRHVMGVGRLGVAVASGDVVGYVASRQVGAADMLCDLFVHADHRGRGVGRALLACAWGDAPHRQTFSSLDPSALPLYVRSGMTPRWPLLYLSGDVGTLPRAEGLTVSGVEAATASSVEEQLTGVDREADYRYWSARPSGTSLVVTRRGEPVAAGAVGGEGRGFGVSHLYAATGDAEPLLAVLGWLSGRAVVTVPGPHPAVPALIGAGWRNEYTDIYLATDEALIDADRLCPHPGLA
ncbi:MAG: GNAT family N-acetyltransferase [Actinomycetota bacterium]|nr:GNAT family N-acetyltransferase [Actinomycetota bacterium]